MYVRIELMLLINPEVPKLYTVYFTTNFFACTRKYVLTANITRGSIDFCFRVPLQDMYVFTNQKYWVILQVIIM